jgi:hypothetical protein
MMDDIKSNIKVWLDDCLLHTGTEDKLLATLNFFFKQCLEHELKLHASKCVLFATTVRYCRSLITKDEVRLTKEHGSAADNARAAERRRLGSVCRGSNWMRSAIPNYSKRVAPLQAALANVFEDKSCWTKKAAAAESLLHL